MLPITAECAIKVVYRHDELAQRLQRPLRCKSEGLVGILSLPTMAHSHAKACVHERLTYMPSKYAVETGFKLLSTKELQSAAELPSEGSKRNQVAEMPHGHFWSFPAPLILPFDDLAEDPDWPPQAVEEWDKEPARNRVDKKRRTIYVCQAPAFSDSVKFMSSWEEPVQGKSKKKQTAIKRPSIDNVADYLSAFYHGLPVKILKEGLMFTEWAPDATKDVPNSIPKYVGLQTTKEIIGIRARGPSQDNVFPAQLNLNDLLDVAMRILPQDAYALLMLVDQDIYESEEDDFCCGRAYGGSRIAVVSSARYNPVLDAQEEVDREHAWPASHCIDYQDEKCAEAGLSTQPRKKAKRKAPASKKNQANKAETPTALSVAVQAHTESSKKNLIKDPTALAGLWLGRVCKTASHELGHCFGMDHCVYYACIMQGTTCLAEDARQPPYCCPIDQTKVLAATGSSLEAQYKALKQFCDKWKDIDLFRAFGSWLDARLSATT